MDETLSLNGISRLRVFGPFGDLFARMVIVFLHCLLLLGMFVGERCSAVSGCRITNSVAANTILSCINQLPKSIVHMSLCNKYTYTQRHESKSYLFTGDIDLARFAELKKE